MTDQQKYEELKLLAEQMKLGVRLELGDFDGGLCTVKEQRVILVNRRHPMARRINIMARALHAAGLDNVGVSQRPIRATRCRATRRVAPTDIFIAG
jgi:hypothetical protein